MLLRQTFYISFTPRGYGLFDGGSMSTSPRICSLRSSDGHTHIKLGQPKLTSSVNNIATNTTQDPFLTVKHIHKRSITIQKKHKVECSGRNNINESTNGSSSKLAFFAFEAGEDRMYEEMKMLKDWLDGGLDQGIRGGWEGWRGWQCKMFVIRASVGGLYW